MTSIIKVDTLQKANGATPTAADLGINTTGTLINYSSTQSKNNISTTSTSWSSTGLSLTYTPLYSNSKLVITLEGGRYWCGTNTVQLNLDLYKNGTSMTGGIWGALYTTGMMHVSHNNRYEETSGSTTSRTYAVYFKTANSGVTTELNNSSTNRIPIALTLQEIAG